MNLIEERIRKLEGRELSLEIARHVLGAKWWHQPSWNSFALMPIKPPDSDHWVEVETGDPTLLYHPIPDYASDMNACFQWVIPAMRAKAFAFSIEDAYAWPSEGWEPGKTGIEFEKRLATDLVVWGSNLASFGEEATGICRASLLALLVEQRLAK